MKIYEVTGKNKTASFALGRLNPATIGHELLVDAIKKEEGDSFLFLTDRAPKLPKDPLTSQDKLDWARKSFNGISIGLAKTVLIAADRLYKMGYKDIVYLEGIDPEKPFPLSKLIKDYNGVPKELHDYNFNSIRVVQLPRDASAADASGMSGTKMREYVQNNDIEGFKTGVTQSAQPYAKEMFKKLQGIMGVDSVDNTDIQETEMKDFFGNTIDQKVLNHPNWHPDLAPFFKPDEFGDNRRAIKNARLRLRNDSKKNEGIFDLISFSGDEMEEKYIPFVIKNIRRYGDKRTKALLMKKFPDIKPVDANRAVKQALDIIAKRG